MMIIIIKCDLARIVVPPDWSFPPKRPEMICSRIKYTRITCCRPRSRDAHFPTFTRTYKHTHTRVCIKCTSERVCVCTVARRAVHEPYEKFMNYAKQPLPSERTAAERLNSRKWRYFSFINARARVHTRMCAYRHLTRAYKTKTTTVHILSTDDALS